MNFQAFQSFDLYELLILIGSVLRVSLITKQQRGNSTHPHESDALRVCGGTLLSICHDYTYYTQHLLKSNAVITPREK